MIEEKWKDIKGYEGLYQVSNLGNIKSFGYGKAILLKQFKDGKYLSVNLCKDKKHKKYKVHRLVAEAFIPNPNNLPIINHKDENKYNNNVENLEWCSVAYNNRYGKRGEKISNAKSKIICQYDLNGILVAEWKGIKKINIGVKVNPSDISACCLGKQKTSKGFIWKYKEE